MAESESGDKGPTTPRNPTLTQRAWRNWGDHPAVAILTVLASLTGILTFLNREKKDSSETSEMSITTPNAVAPAPVQPAPDKCANIAGRWDWHTIGGIVAIAETGTMAWFQSPDDRLPVVTGTWECDRSNQRRITFRWMQTGMVDTMVLSRDGQRFAGANMATGFKLSGTRSSR